MLGKLRPQLLDGPAPDLTRRISRAAHPPADLVPWELLLVPPRHGLAVMLRQQCQRLVEGPVQLGPGPHGCWATASCSRVHHAFLLILPAVSRSPPRAVPRASRSPDTRAGGSPPGTPGSAAASRAALLPFAPGTPRNGAVLRQTCPEPGQTPRAWPGAPPRSLRWRSSADIADSRRDPSRDRLLCMDCRCCPPAPNRSV